MNGTFLLRVWRTVLVATAFLISAPRTYGSPKKTLKYRSHQEITVGIAHALSRAELRGEEMTRTKLMIEQTLSSAQLKRLAREHPRLWELERTPQGDFFRLKEDGRRLVGLTKTGLFVEITKLLRKRPEPGVTRSSKAKPPRNQ